MILVATLLALGIGYAVSEGTAGHVKPAPDLPPSRNLDLDRETEPSSGKFPE